MREVSRAASTQDPPSTKSNKTQSQLSNTASTFVDFVVLSGVLAVDALGGGAHPLSPFVNATPA